MRKDLPILAALLGTLGVLVYRLLNDDSGKAAPSGDYPPDYTTPPDPYTPPDNSYTPPDYSGGADTVPDKPLYPPVTGGYQGGLLSNNPGNLRDTPDTWQGEIGRANGPGGNFVIFDSPANGLRALGIVLLRNWIATNGTLSGLIARYSPPSENNTDQLIRYYSNTMNFPANQRINLRDTATLAQMIGAVTHIENGQDPFSATQKMSAASAALAHIYA